MDDIQVIARMAADILAASMITAATRPSAHELLSYTEAAVMARALFVHVDELLNEHPIERIRA